jgi:diguanylate cyclase (GGDEF)-like protein
MLQNLFSDRSRRSLPAEVLRRYKSSADDILAFRLRIIALCGSVLFMGFIYEDRLLFPTELILPLVKMRVLVCLILLSCFTVTLIKRFRNHIVWVADLACISTIAGVCYVVYLTDGVNSAYYKDGFTVVFLALLIGNSFYYKHQLMAGLVSVLLYTAAVRGSAVPFDAAKYSYSIYIIGSVVFFVALMVRLYEMEHFYGFARNEALTQSENNLTDANKKLEVLFRNAEEMSKIDDLTKIYNRRHFFDVLNGKIESCAKEGVFFYVVIFDIDHFKKINDTHGHLAGDKVIKLVAEAVSSNMRPKSYIGRYGGDEFLIIIDKADQEVFLKRVGRLQEMIGGIKFTTGDQPIKISMTVGAVRVNPGQYRSAERVVEAADMALIEAKRRCRGTINLLE